MKKQVTNILFFLRHDEPRIPELDLFRTLEQQSRLIDEYNFPVTYLLEYDSLIDERYRAILSAQKARMGERCEIGGWFEIVKPLVERAGLVWRGREGYSWDWYSNVGFSVGYTQEERRRLADTFMADFQSYFGEYPKTVGSWVIDAYTLAYLSDVYHIEASCNCRDQWGTDGYTLWGGYYAQAYYPSRQNMLCPANSESNQIPVPIFRMLGNDPIYQEDSKMEMDEGYVPDTCVRDCLTLEPVYQADGGGGTPEWVDWFLKETFKPETLSFNYVHAGQENSFSWKDQEEGTRYQFEKIKQMVNNGTMALETMSQTGRWYRKNYPVTPASSITAFTDWHGLGHQSFWYNSRFYRMNLLVDHGRLLLRDMQAFHDSYAERYYSAPCPDKVMIYDNLPIVDGNRWSRHQTRAGVQIGLADGTQVKELLVKNMAVSYPDEQTMVITASTEDGDFIIACKEKTITFSTKADRQIRLQLTAGTETSVVAIEPQKITMCHNHFSYALYVEEGMVTDGNGSARWRIASEENSVTLRV